MARTAKSPLSEASAVPARPPKAKICMQERGRFRVRKIFALVSGNRCDQPAPVLVRFTTIVASRFGIVLSQKFAAQALPFVGALGGASVNNVLIEHFQEIAHFTVRRLERVYGKDIVRAEYERLAQDH
jgi:hypothetical protein